MFVFKNLKKEEEAFTLSKAVWFASWFVLFCTKNPNVWLDLKMRDHAIQNFILVWCRYVQAADLK